MRFQDTVLSGLLKAIPRGRFARLVAAHGSDRRVRRLPSWNQLVALLVAQLGGCRSLRELEALLASQPGSHYHLGIDRVCRSTLAAANAIDRSRRSIRPRSGRRQQTAEGVRPACSRCCSAACWSAWPNGCRRASAARRCA